MGVRFLVVIKDNEYKCLLIKILVRKFVYVIVFGGILKGEVVFGIYKLKIIMGNFVVVIILFKLIIEVMQILVFNKKLVFDFKVSLFCFFNYELYKGKLKLWG